MSPCVNIFLELFVLCPYSYFLSKKGDGSQHHYYIQRSCEFIILNDDLGSNASYRWILFPLNSFSQSIWRLDLSTCRRHACDMCWLAYYIKSIRFYLTCMLNCKVIDTRCVFVSVDCGVFLIYFYLNMFIWPDNTQDWHPTTCVPTKNNVTIIEEFNKIKLTYRINIKTILLSKQPKKHTKNSTKYKYTFASSRYHLRAI